MSAETYRVVRDFVSRFNSYQKTLDNIRELKYNTKEKKSERKLLRRLR